MKLLEKEVIELKKQRSREKRVALSKRTGSTIDWHLLERTPPPATPTYNPNSPGYDPDVPIDVYPAASSSPTYNAALTPTKLHLFPISPIKLGESTNVPPASPKSPIQILQEPIPGPSHKYSPQTSPHQANAPSAYGSKIRKVKGGKGWRCEICRKKYDTAASAVLCCLNQLIHRQEIEQTCFNSDRNLLKFVYSFVIRLTSS